jgi:hypothetical protein
VRAKQRNLSETWETAMNAQKRAADSGEKQKIEYKSSKASVYVIGCPKGSRSLSGTMKKEIREQA